MMILDKEYLRPTTFGLKTNQKLSGMNCPLTTFLENCSVKIT